MPMSSRAGTFDALRHRDFARFWAAGVAAQTGTWVQLVTVPFVIDEITHSTAWVGIAVFCCLLPNALFSPIAGALADRLPKRLLLVTTMSALVATSVALFVLWATGVASRGSILACVVIWAVANGLNAVVWQASLHDVVPPESLLNAVRLTMAGNQSARVLGPALAGIALATVGAASAFVINAVSYGVVLLVVLVLPSHATRAAPAPGLFRAIGEGVVYVRGHPALAVVVRVTFVFGFVGASTLQIAEAIARHVFEIGSGGYGALVAVYGIGGIAGVALNLRLGDAVRRSVFALVGMTACAVGQIVLALTPFYLAGLAVFGVMGVAHGMVMISLNTTVQAKSDEELRGRAMSLFIMAFIVAIPLGALTQGLLAEVVGLRTTIAGCGVILGGFVLVALLRLDRLSAIDLPDQPANAQDEPVASTLAWTLDRSEPVSIAEARHWRARRGR